MKNNFVECDKSYIYLVLGSILLLFFNGRWIVPIAVWLGPAFIVRFYRHEKSFKRVIISLLVFIFTSFFSFKGVTSIKSLLEYVVLTGMGLAFFIPYFIDIYFYDKVNGFKKTLILPLAGVTFEYLFSTISPYATFGCLAYTQFGNISIMQLASITGIWGISFIIYWFYSFINWVWENRKDFNRAKKGICIFCIIYITITFLGGLRNTLSNDSLTVRAASISIPMNHLFKDPDIKAVRYNLNSSNEQKLSANKKLTKLHNELLNLTEKQANAGCKIVLWHEANAIVFKQNEDKLIQNIRQLAKNKKIYIAACLYTLEPGQKQTDNKVIFINQNGDIAFTYRKATVVPGDTNMKGDGIIKYVDTKYGRIGTAICFDADFPWIIRQAGNKKIDILLVPGSDWKEIDPLHTRMAVFRCVENGFSMIRQVNLGLSLAADSRGNVISSMDYFNTEEKVMISNVPTKGVSTIYSKVGDVFPWICMITLFILLIMKKFKNISEKDD